MMKHLVAVLIALLVILSTRLSVYGLLQIMVLDLFLMIFLPLIFLSLKKEKVKNIGVQCGNLKLGLKYSFVLILFAIPIMLYGATLSDFRHYYPIWEPARYSWHDFFIFESAVFVLMFCTEFFYRGFLLFSLTEKTRYGNLIHSLLYAVAHLGKPTLEVPYSFFVGYIFGEVDLKCRSILPSFLMHFISSVLFDLFIILL